MTVFLVTCGRSPSDWWIVGIYSSRVLAEQVAAKANTAMRAKRDLYDSPEMNYADIEEYVLDETK